jgi:hypothetical protein
MMMHPAKLLFPMCEVETPPFMNLSTGDVASLGYWAKRFVLKFLDLRK